MIDTNAIKVRANHKLIYLVETMIKRQVKIMYDQLYSDLYKALSANLNIRTFEEPEIEINDEFEGMEVRS